MQIKRFEAEDMTEALRLVKRAFGDDAVILSAKENRPRGFFGAWKKKRVEITAAADYPLERNDDEKEFTGLLARQLDAINAADRVSLSSAPPAPDSFSGRRPSAALKKEGKEAAGRLDRETSASIQPEKTFVQRVTSRSQRQAPGECFHGCASGKRDVFLSEPDDAPLLAEPFTAGKDKKQVVALVGPPGAGKSTTLAKLAWHCRRVEQRTVGLISLDRYRMAANSLLNRFAGISGLTLSVIYDVDGLQSALNELKDADVILIDTPGVGRGDRLMMETVCSLLNVADPDETHLVLNATVRDSVLAATVEHFRPADPNRLLFTHLDECDSHSVSMQLLNEFRLPSAFLSDGVDLVDNLKTTTADRLKAFASPGAPAGGRVTMFPGKKRRPRMKTEENPNGSASARFLANRNSELFHDPACKSVKRINAENIIAFDSIEQAIGEGFKPCRACCNIEMIRKMAIGSAAFQRAKAM